MFFHTSKVQGSNPSTLRGVGQTCSDLWRVKKEEFQSLEAYILITQIWGFQTVGKADLIDELFLWGQRSEQQ